MPDFKKRSLEKELLDQPEIPFNDIRVNMEELNVINKKLGGHKITITGLKKIISKNKIVTTKASPLRIVEIGCGGGDNLTAIIRWANKRSIFVKCTGVDINSECIAFAKTRDLSQLINFICADYRSSLNDVEKPDIIFNSLFCHHFTDDEMVSMMKWMNINATYGAMINDLHRHPVAYYSIKFLTQIFSNSYLVKNDAPLSVLRAFKKTELEKIISEAGFSYYDLEWKWAFRWLLVFGRDWNLSSKHFNPTLSEV